MYLYNIDSENQALGEKESRTICVVSPHNHRFLPIYRWEKLQTEEEAALGRGKRLRKNISYSESMGVKLVEASVDVSIWIPLLQ